MLIELGEDDEEDANNIQIQGLVKYCEDLQTDPEDPVMLPLAYALAAPTMGTLAKDGFVKGWLRLGYLEVSH